MTEEFKNKKLAAENKKLKKQLSEWSDVVAEYEREREEAQEKIQCLNAELEALYSTLDPEEEEAQFRAWSDDLDELEKAKAENELLRTELKGCECPGYGHDPACENAGAKVIMFEKDLLEERSKLKWFQKQIQIARKWVREAYGPGIPGTDYKERQEWLKHNPEKNNEVIPQ